MASSDGIDEVSFPNSSFSEESQTIISKDKRMLDKSIRDIERARQWLQTKEKKLIAEIKKSTKQGHIVELMNSLISDLADVDARGRAIIDGYEALLASIAALQISGPLLDETQVGSIVDEIKQVITTSSSRKERGKKEPKQKTLMQKKGNF